VVPAESALFPPITHIASLDNLSPHFFSSVKRHCRPSIEDPMPLGIHEVGARPAYFPPHPPPILVCTPTRRPVEWPTYLDHLTEGSLTFTLSTPAARDFAPVLPLVHPSPLRT